MNGRTYPNVLDGREGTVACLCEFVSWSSRGPEGDASAAAAAARTAGQFTTVNLGGSEAQDRLTSTKPRTCSSCAAQGRQDATVGSNRAEQRPSLKASSSHGQPAPKSAQSITGRPTGACLTV